MYLFGLTGFQKPVLTVAAVWLGCLVGAQVASARVWQVNSTADPGSGCSAANCTLRAAIGSAAAGDVVDVPAGTYNLTAGPIHVATSISIVGAGMKKVKIDAGGSSQIFLIPAGANVGVTGVTVGHGFKDGDGGAIRVDGSLTLSQSAIRKSRANDSGGAIYSDGTLSVTDTTFSGNTAANGGGVYNDAPGTMTVQDSTFTQNQAGGGGGIYDNSTTASQVANSTITANTATQGGGINDSNTGLGLKGINLTIVSNSARDGSNVYFNNVTTGGLEDTIVALPLGIGNNCFGNSAPPPVSLGHNLEDDARASCRFGAATNDLVGVAPQLGPLAFNGGPTKTMALQAGSPAINAAATVKGVTTDQRGGPRPQPAGGPPDIGAYELGALADLKLSMKGAPSPATVGKDLVYTLKATYTGPTTDPAFGVQVASNVPSGVTLKSVSASQGSCSHGSATTACNVGTLAKGASVTVKVTVIPLAIGKTQSAGLVTGSGLDPDLANNGASVHLMVQNRPAVHTDAAQGVLFKKATLRGNVNANNAATTYLFQYGTTTSYGSHTSSAGVGHGASAVAVSNALHGLKPGTVYHYRIVATNSSGQTIGHDRTFRTPQLPSLHVTPAKVTAGEHIHVYGNAGTCPVGATLTLYSPAFPFTHKYQGQGAIYTTVKSGGAFSAFVQIPSSRQGGPYPVAGKCGKLGS